jgi:hypothetical protein
MPLHTEGHDCELPPAPVALLRWLSAHDDELPVNERLINEGKISKGAQVDEVPALRI